MAQPSWAGIITAFSTVLTAVGLIITAVAALRKAGQVERKVDQVHVIVNQQRTDMQRYIRAQTALLLANGIEPPIDQSIDPAEA